MPLGKGAPVALLQGKRLLAAGRAAEFVVENDDIRFVDHPEAALPQPQAVVGLLVISWGIALVETTELVPEAARREQEGAGAVVHIAAEHEFWIGRIAPATVA